MMSFRILWRLCVLPLYVVLAGAVFALAMARTAGSIIGALAPLAPFALAISVVLAVLLIAGGLARCRRRLRACRRATAARAATEARHRATSPVQPYWLDGRDASWGAPRRG